MAYKKEGKYYLIIVLNISLVLYWSHEAAYMPASP